MRPGSAHQGFARSLTLAHPKQTVKKECNYLHKNYSYIKNWVKSWSF